MSFSKRHFYSSSPRVERGRAIHLKGDPKKGKNFLYCNGSSVFIIDIDNPLICDQYTEHQYNTTVAAYSPSGYYIASGDSAGYVRIWDTINQEHVLKLEIRPISGAIYDIDWTFDSKRIVVGGDGKDVFGCAFLWDTGATVGTIAGHSKPITSVSFKPNRPFKLVTSSEDQQCNFYKGPPFKFTHSLREHEKFINCTRFSPDGKFFMSVGSDRKGFLYNGKEGTLVKEISDNENGHKGGIYSLSWSPDSTQVLTASADKTCKLWDIETSKVVTTFTFSERPTVQHQQLGTLWQGKHMLSVNLGGDISYLDSQNPNTPHRVIKGHMKLSKKLAVDKKSDNFYTGGSTGYIRSWKYDEGSLEGFKGKAHDNTVIGLDVCEEQIYSLSKDNKFLITPTTETEFNGSQTTFDVSPTCLGVSQAQPGLSFIGFLDSTIKTLNQGDVKGTTKIDCIPTCIAVSPNGENVAVGGKDKKIRIMVISNNELETLYVLEGHRGQITDVKFSPNGEMLAVTDSNRYLMIYKGKELLLGEWCFHTARVECVDWNEDNIHLVSGSLDSAIFIWNIEQPKKRIKIKTAHIGGVSDVKWKNSNVVLSTGADATIKSWNIEF
eukprot:Anaeramoba_flamelloidesa1053595_706.p1 GENE.a1053595_706~~a1053595_706.p1  ORF type:complete len:617 (+),score=98.11 a1053595_706:34-1851(+)